MKDFPKMSKKVRVHKNFDWGWDVDYMSCGWVTFAIVGNYNEAKKLAAMIRRK